MKIRSYLALPMLTWAKPVSYHRRDPYDFEDECRIDYSEDLVFAVVEDITRTGNTLRVGHFSVDDRFRGFGIAKTCLRKFARRIAQLDPTIDFIEFDLYRGPTNFDHARIAQARFDLLKRIGAVSVQKTPAPQNRFTVTGMWPRKAW